jgi:pyridinium-3,5-biscarboxylic acid mononucleotide sulfurtransferase
METAKKIEIIKREMEKARSALIAFSGGVDSSLLLHFALKYVAGEVLAVTCVSPLYKSREIEKSKRIAKELGSRHLLVHINELKDPEIVKNDRLRCYYCKKNLFTRLKEIAGKEGLQRVFDGSNHDDTKDYRPGLKALKELGIKSPLLEAGLTKDEIRTLIKKEGLSFGDMESLACLGSRFPYGTSLKKETLKKIDESEDFLIDLGFRNVRVRHYNEMAKIELNQQDIIKAVRARHKITEYFKKKGYTQISVDLEGYRMGSLNNENK